MTLNEADIQRWMARCRELAEVARANGDAPVGAVIVRHGEIIAEGIEEVRLRKDVAAHAELIALRHACTLLDREDLSDCLLVTNVEPCWMCSFALRETRIGAVLWQSPVTDIGGITSRYPILSDDTIAGWGPPPLLRQVASQ